MTIDLEKKLNERKKMVFDLAKSKGIENQKAQVVLVMDHSGSMNSMYSSGLVQEVVERIVPLAMQFDDNGEMEMYIFDNVARRLPKNVTLKNVMNYVNAEIYRKYPMGGTEYAPPMTKIFKDYGKAKGGFFSKSAGVMDLPVYVIFITDGQNDDARATREELKAASNTGIFYQFVGIGGSDFPFLEKLDDLAGRALDNANFCAIRDIKSMPDSELYTALLAEFPGWVPQARSKNFIK